MRINHNINSMVTQSARNGNIAETGKSLEKLSTGLRINRASDDAAGLSVSEQMRTQIKGLGRAKANAQDGIALLQIAEGAANEQGVMLQRMRELSIQSSNDTLTSTDRSYLDQEFTALTNEIDRISKTTQYNGQTLIDGGATSFGGAGSASSVLHIGANDVVGTDTMTIEIDGLSAAALGLTTGGANAVGVSTQASALAAIGSIDTAIKSVNNMRSDVGAYVNRLEHAINNMDNQEYNTQDAESRIRDVDFAAESTKFTKNQILTQSSTSMLAQANQAPNSVMSLIG
ncbi:flagellin [Fibrobacterales bacterium]|nr:flagellin [Fibrobacterales bacterium]